MDENNNESQSEYKDKKCFIITPIGDEKSEIRRHIEGVINSAIKPALMDIGFISENIIAAHDIAKPGSINNQVIGCILNNDLIIANLTGLNPNVMYELAIRHGTAKPIVHICEKGTKLPFDINNERTISYTNDMYGVIELRDKLKKFVIEALKGENLDNPIYRVLKDEKLFKDVNIKDKNQYIQQQILNGINTIKQSINEIDDDDYRENRIKYGLYRVSCIINLDDTDMNKISKSINDGNNDLHNNIISISLENYNVHNNNNKNNQKYVTFDLKVKYIGTLSTSDILELLDLNSKGMYTVATISYKGLI